MYIPQTIINSLEKVGTFIEQSIEYLLLSFLLSLATIPLILKETGERRLEALGYSLSGFLLGVTGGVISANTPMLHNFDYVVSSLATIVGPATYSMIRRKTLFDVINMYSKAKEGKLEDKEDERK